MPTIDALLRVEASRDERVLILAPIGRDAAMMSRFLQETGLVPQVCDDYQAFCRELSNDCGAALLTDEALTPEALQGLAHYLGQQQPWSDVPLLVLTSGGGETPINADSLAALGEVGNVTLIERPVRAATLLSSIKAALRARRRQYDVRDHLTALIRAKEALRLGEERLRIALDASHLGAWQHDLATGHIDCTPRCTAHFGLPDDATFTHAVLLAAIHPDDLPAMQSARQLAIRERTDYRCEYRVVWPDGSVHWLVSSGRARYDNNGQAYVMVGVTADITERKKAEQEREELLAREQAARLEAEAASRLKDEFLATVSHELRTPLMAILGWSNLLRTGMLDESTVASAMETIERNANSQVQLINDLLDVSRITRGQLRLSKRPVELSKIIEAAVDAVRPLAETSGISLNLDLRPIHSPVSGDADRLQQVVWNLLNNAVKFTPAGGNIEVCLQEHNGQAEIKVVDSGKGIDPQFLPAVFDAFRQADQTSTRRYGGLGLGLSIVSQLVALHGGSVKALSEGEGKGSTFVVCLPLGNAIEEATDSVTPPATPDVRTFNGSSSNGATPHSTTPEGLTRLDNIRVLLVEDEADTREVLETLFRHCGAIVEGAESASQALQLLESWQPDVLVSDIGLPEEDGFSLIAQVRAHEAERGGHLPAIALTAFAKANDRDRALKAGFQIHLSKPVEPAELTIVVAGLLAAVNASS